MNTIEQSNSSIQAQNQVVNIREDPRELVDEEKLSPLDLEIRDRVIEKARLLPREMECTPMIGQVGLGESDGVTPYLGRC